MGAAGEDNAAFQIEIGDGKNIIKVLLILLHCSS